MSSKKQILRVPLFDLRISADEKRAVTNTLSSGWVTTGPVCRKLESAVTELTGSKYACAVSSATAGLHLALQALDVGPGDEVIVPSFTFSATVASVLYVGATPVFADIDPTTLNISVESVKRVLSRKSKAVISVDMAGLPCNYGALGRLCREHKVKLICDAAHSLGAFSGGKSIGAHGAATVFSLYATKNITAGEGGVVATNSRKLAERVGRLSLHGITKPTAERNSVGRWRYDVAELGHKYNLSDINASLALAQLSSLDRRLKRRERVALIYHKGLARFTDYFTTPVFGGDGKRVWHLYIIQLNADRWTISRDRFIEELGKLGVGAGVHYIPVHRLSYFKKYCSRPATALPVSERIWRNVVTLPLYPELSNSQVAYTVESLSRLVERFGR